LTRAAEEEREATQQKHDELVQKCGEGEKELRAKKGQQEQLNTERRRTDHLVGGRPVATMWPLAS
jgi:hypothetical protein